MFFAAFDWHQLWELVSAPDNVPIVLMLFLLPFYLMLGFRAAIANDRLIAELEGNADQAKSHHRKTYPWHPSWDRTVSVWPYLLKMEFLAAIIVTIVLIVWSVFLNAPLEEPANPTLTMNPSKAPWYFLGLQEMLVYFDPWIAGVVAPGVILGGLMAIPYIDVNPLGNGYYTWKQRRFAITTFMFGFLILWVVLIVIGTFIRGPGWMWFWPGETWDHTRVVFEVNRDLHEFFGIQQHETWKKFFFGGGVVTLFVVLCGGAFHLFFKRFAPATYAKMSMFQYATLQGLMIPMIAFPVKMVLRLAFTVKYVWVTPWFNV
jgi:hypothetical protein